MDRGFSRVCPCPVAVSREQRCRPKKSTRSPVQRHHNIPTTVTREITSFLFISLKLGVRTVVVVVGVVDISYKGRIRFPRNKQATVENEGTTSGMLGADLAAQRPAGAEIDRRILALLLEASVLLSWTTLS